MRTHLFAVAAVLASLMPAAAQTSAPIQIRVRQQDSVFIVPNGSTLNMAATAVGKPVSLSITITYQGNTTALFSAPPALVGSTAFTFSSIGELPLTLQQNSSFTFNAIYTPVSATTAGAQVSIGYTEAGLIPGSPSVAGNILLNLTGTTPDISLSYALSANANVVPIATGGTLSFGEIPVNTTPTATFIILNRGGGSGPVTSVAITGEAFQLVSLPLLPATLAGNTALQFGIRYSPKKIGPDTGSLRITLGADSATITLQGSGTGSTFSYELLPETGDRTEIQPNQSIAVPDTAVAGRFSYIVQVRNNGNAPGPVNIISVSGVNFVLADLPFLPFTLAPNEFLSFTLTFQPTQPGRLTGRLRIGNDVFDLAGTGIGSKLTYSYNNGTVATTVQSPGAVLFSPLPVGQSVITRFEIKNEGTAAAAINSIGISETRGVFRLETPPQLPASLDPGATLAFNIAFTPAVTGLSTAQLLVDTQIFTLSGFASQPPPLPGFQFSGATGTVDAFQQPGVRLTLLDPYPIAVQGVLTLTIESESFSADPAVQFSSGGRSVTFTIPANTTEAVFPNGAKEIRLQTGTVAGVLTLTPSFATQSGLDLTPAPAANKTLKLTVPRRAPGLVSLQVAARSADSVTLLITGFTTTRSIRNAEVQFTGKADAKIAETRFTLDLGTISTAWFRTTASEPFGGQFSLTIPFTFRASTAVTQPIIDSLESASLTVTNEAGTSNRLSVPLQ
ncbi:MAG: choice-of-anchor D domain-containing protein [Bryobacterales bacterium]|nr:choice-of-anchor D domain-containing protein [Bryobacterales bacterium]